MIYGYRQRVGHFATYRSRYIFFIRGKVKCRFIKYDGRKSLWMREIRCLDAHDMAERRDFLDKKTIDARIILNF